MRYPAREQAPEIFANAVKEAMQKIGADLPIGIEYQLVANQPTVVEENIAEFTKSLEEAFAIVLFVSFLSLGLRAGAVVAFSIPLVLTIVFLAMEFFHIDLQRISLGALIIALGLSGCKSLTQVIDGIIYRNIIRLSSTK